MLIKNIKTLVGILPQGVLRLCGSEMNTLNTLDNAYLMVEDGLIKEFGKMEQCPDYKGETIDASGKMVFPSFCDSHTHIVFAGSREGEFLDKINGLSYEEIAKRGGGILNSARLLHETSEDELYRQALRRLKMVIGFGTGAIEIKSGYGLSTEDELKMLRVIKRLSQATPATVKATFLGAHAFPQEYKNGREDEYIDLLCNEMLPKVAEQQLAEYVDGILRQRVLHRRADRTYLGDCPKVRYPRQDTRQRTRFFGWRTGWRQIQCTIGRPSRVVGRKRDRGSQRL